jgi:tetratricopeptide (TPR) repeat protein
LTLPEAQALMVLGGVSFGYDWNPAESEAFFRRSIAARPGYAMAHMLFAIVLAHYGKVEEAVQQAQVASALDPVSVEMNSLAWHVYFSARKYDEALRIIRAALEVDPNFGPGHFRLALSLEQKGEYQKAIEAHPDDASELSAALASGGPRGYWQRKLEIQLRGRTPEARGGFTPIARSYMRLGKREEALQTLEKAYQVRDPRLMFWLPAFEEFDQLRSEPRFQKLLHDLGIS